MLCEEANSNSNYAIHNNQTTQNQSLIINTLTNENEKTPTPKTKATHIKSGHLKRSGGKRGEEEERESLRDRLRKGYEKSTKIVGSGEDELQSFRDIREDIWVGNFIIGYRINDNKREEELVRNSLFYSLKLRTCYLLITVFKSKRIVIFKTSKNYSRVKEKYARTRKSQSVTITKNQEASSHHYTPNPP